MQLSKEIAKLESRLRLGFMSPQEYAAAVVDAAYADAARSTDTFLFVGMIAGAVATRQEAMSWNGVVDAITHTMPCCDDGPCHVIESVLKQLDETGNVAHREAEDDGTVIVSVVIRN